MKYLILLKFTSVFFIKIFIKMNEKRLIQKVQNVTVFFLTLFFVHQSQTEAFISPIYVRVCFFVFVHQFLV